MRTSYQPPKNRKYFHTKSKIGKKEMTTLKIKKEIIDQRKYRHSLKIKKDRIYFLNSQK